MTTALARFHSTHNPSPDKSPIQKWIARLTGAHGSTSATMHHAAHGVRQYGEAGIVGVATAAIESYKPQMTDKALLAATIGGAVGSVWKATEEYATDLRNIGANAFTLLTYRKGKELIAKKRGTMLAAHGEGDDMGIDPVIEASKEL